MAILYDQYQLSNSTQIPRFVGSTLPEMQRVADVYQNRYDYGVQQSDLLDQAIKTSQAAGVDQPLLDDLKKQYREKMSGYAKSGNYEDTWRNVMLDAREFVNKYKPIAENKQRIATYQNELEKLVETGKIDRDTANARLRREMDVYAGLRYNDKTQQYDNSFSGAITAHSVDLPKKINSWLEGSEAVKRGWKVKRIDGDFYQTNGTERELLPWSKVKQIVDAGMAIDPEVQSYMAQEKELAPYRLGLSSRLSDGQVLRILEDNPQHQAAVVAGINKGQSATEALFDVIGETRFNNILRGVDQYATKGIVDKQSSLSETELTSVGSARRIKEIEDSTLSLAATILQPDRTVAYTPGTLDKTLDERKAAVTKTQQDFSTWVSRHNIRPDGKGGYIDKDGNDVSVDYNRTFLTLQQAANANKNLETFKKKAKEDSGFIMTPELQKQAQAAYDETYNKYKASSAGTGAPGVYSEELRKKDAQNSYDAALRNSPGYKRYKELLDEYSKTSQFIGVQTFNKKSANEEATNYFKNFALNLDQNGLEFGAMGMEWATGKNASTPLSAGDYNMIRDKAVFAGTGIDADGQLKFYYKVGDIDSKKGGDELVVKMPALPGTADLLRKGGQLTQAQYALGKWIDQLETTQKLTDVGGAGKIDLGDDDYVNITKNPDATYNLQMPIEGGKFKVVSNVPRSEAVGWMMGYKVAQVKK
jgi:hypothetical protein